MGHGEECVHQGTGRLRGRGRKRGLAAGRRELAAGDRSHTIRLWKDNFTPDGLIETPADAVLGLAYIPGKPLLVSAGSDGIARLWQLPVAKPATIDSRSASLVFAVSHEGNRAAAAGADKIVRVWTLAEGKLVKEIAGNDQPVIALGLSGNGSQAAVGLANNVVRICSADDGKEIRKIGPLLGVDHGTLLPQRCRSVRGRG